MASVGSQSINLEEISKKEFLDFVNEWGINPLYPKLHTGYFEITSPLIFGSYWGLVNDCKDRPFTSDIRIFDKGKWKGFRADRLTSEQIRHIEKVASLDQQKRNYFEVKLSGGFHDISNANDMCGRVRFAEINKFIISYEIEMPRIFCEVFNIGSRYRMNRCILNKKKFLDKFLDGNTFSPYEFGVPTHAQAL